MGNGSGNGDRAHQRSGEWDFTIRVFRFPLDGSTNYNPLKCSWVWLPVTIKWDKLGWSRHYKRGLAAPGASGVPFRPMAKKGSNLLMKTALFCIRMTRNWENDRGGKSERQIALALRTLSKCVKVERVISTSAFGKTEKEKSILHSAFFSTSFQLRTCVFWHENRCYDFFTGDRRKLSKNHKLRREEVLEWLYTIICVTWKMGRFVTTSYHLVKDA